VRQAVGSAHRVQPGLCPDISGLLPQGSRRGRARQSAPGLVPGALGTRLAVGGLATISA
jgi:hypothetical protein